MVITTRIKVLGAAAAAILVYVVATNPEPQTGNGVELARSTNDRPARTAVTKVGRDVSSRGSASASATYASLSHRVTDAHAAPALFGSQSWFVPPPPPPPQPVAQVIETPPPPTAPPLPFAAMGSYTRPGDATVYFLTRGEQVFDVRVGDTIDHLYSVDSANDGQLQLTYKPLNIQQTLTLGGSL